MLFTIFATIVLQAITSTQGLNCWVCENQRSNRACILYGGMTKCAPNEDVCQNEIRRDDQGFLLSKRCKQANACNSNFLQNTRPAYVSSQCSDMGPNSVCRCCCPGSGCNKQAMFNCMQPAVCKNTLEKPGNGSVFCDKKNEVGSKCRFTCKSGFMLIGEPMSVCIAQDGGNMPTWSSDPPTCLLDIRNSFQLCFPQITSLANGTVFCTNSYVIGSQCVFICDDNFNLDGKEIITCGEGLWSALPPVCRERVSCTADLECPPYTFIDLAFVIDSSASIGIEDFEILKNFVSETISDFAISDDAVRVSIVQYSTRVDTNSAIAFNSYNDSQETLLKKFEQVQYLAQDTNTGLALEYTRDVLFAEGNGKRDGARDVVVVLTDGVSADSIGQVSLDLRRNDVLVFAVAIGRRVDFFQLLEITAYRENLFSLSAGFIGLDAEFSALLGTRICTETCSQEILCQPRHVSPSNGEILCTDGNRLGSECHFGCNTGYQMIGEEISTCLETGTGFIGTWSSSAPSCVEQQRNQLFCPLVQRAPSNGEVFCSDGNSAGSDCFFSCREGFSVKGNEIVKCNLDGRWSSSAPICRESVSCLPERGCPPYINMDLTIVMDSSASIGQKDYMKLKKFVSDVVGDYILSDESVRVSIVQYSTYVDVESAIFVYSSREKILEKLEHFEYLGQDTRTGLALKYANDVIGAYGNRPDSRQVVVVLTDGVSADSVDEISQELRNKEVLIFAVSIGRKVDFGELLSMTNNIDYVLQTTGGFESLNSEFSSSLGNKLCKAVCFNI